MKQKATFTVVELFAGEGGFVAGFDKIKGWKHLAAVELDEKHAKTLRQIFPDLTVIRDDVDNVKWDETLKGAQADCVIGGPPCQPFSRGSTHPNGWDDPRNGIPAFVKAVKEIKPKTFLMENVPTVWWKKYRHHIVDEVIEPLKASGYTFTNAVILDAVDFGSPCHRKRLFIYGTYAQHSLPEKTHAKGSYKSARQYLEQLLKNREPDGAPLPDWVKPKIRGAKGDIIIDCKQGNKIGAQYVKLDAPCFTLVASQGIRHRIRYKGELYRMRAAEAAALQGMDSRCSIEGIGNAVNVWQAEAWAKCIRDYLLSLDE
jgi:site-specific DNA-cytosine methylase